MTLRRSYMTRGTKPMKRVPLRRALEPKRVPGTSREREVRRRKRAAADLKWQKAVRERDNFTCQFPGCGTYNKHIDTHHVAKRSQRPDLRHEMSNGICLCRLHHNWTDTHHDEAVSLRLLSIETYELAHA
jgi:predicted restriction endonuclease